MQTRLIYVASFLGLLACQSEVGSKKAIRLDEASKHLEAVQLADRGTQYQPASFILLKTIIKIITKKIPYAINYIVKVLDVLISWTKLGEKTWSIK